MAFTKDYLASPGSCQVTTETQTPVLDSLPPWFQWFPCVLCNFALLTISWKYFVIFFSLRIFKRKNCLKYIFIIFATFVRYCINIVYTQYRCLKKKKKKLNTFLCFKTRTKILFKYPFSSNYNFYFTRKNQNYIRMHS